MFRKTFKLVQQLIDLKNDPIKAIKHPFENFATGLAALKALPLKNPINKPVLYEEIKISDLPLIKHYQWMVVHLLRCHKCILKTLKRLE
jgi:4-hydroxy-3-polyprenylbenzoate decarboxylase